MKYLKLVLTLCICATGLVGDYIVFKSSYSQSQLFRAILDELVHASIGFFSAALFFTHEINVSNYACVCNVIFCTVMSSIIDIDHAFVAKSLHLKDMTNLKRGIFHCTTFWLVITSGLLTYSYIARKTNIYILTYMLIIAFTSHHIRDGNRRGLWLYPFGHSPPIPKSLYIFLIALLPHVYGFLYKCMEPVYKHTVINYKYNIVV